MQHYYVSKDQSKGTHEIHVPRCSYLPEADDRVYLGSFTTCSDALQQARSRFAGAKGCQWCCPEE